MLKKTGIAFSIVIASIVVYSAGVLYQASVYTEEVILSDYKNKEWRIFKGEKHSISLKKEDLTQNLKILVFMNIRE